ncbi:hypothetical protein SteCoe_9697 [Stentor coeruleus]|uniref:Zinc finger LSD1-type domain-containing protein n=1 Tax=Stentor coeruleus TaxID=5963 RepID=A0A1R2CH73_9CILI|nr:hypothetical protein SteCoe_9697 [Stentor coeruleus]
MANKASMAIELKDFSSYPVLEEEIKSVPPPPVENKITSLPPPSIPQTNLGSDVQRPVSSPPGLTPVVPVQSNPPPLSYAEEQRLKQQQANLQAPRAYPNLPLPPQRNTLPASQEGFSTVTCCGCRGIISHPISAYIVVCSNCRASTATKPLINISCVYCMATSYYPADSGQVRCRCGAVYSVRAG